MPTFDEENLRAGIASTRLLTEPAGWINRRVETVELLSQEETRWRVSVDFTIADDTMEELTTPDGIVVPISFLSKEARRNFDLRDESDRALPVLGASTNAELAHIAALNAAVEAAGEIGVEALEMLSADIGRIVSSPQPDAEDALAYFVGGAESGDPLRAGVWGDPSCRSLLLRLVGNYVLFAVLGQGGPNRRIAKFSYGGDFGEPEPGSFRERFDPKYVAMGAWQPDRKYFYIDFPMAAYAASFHTEIVIPEELRIERAFLWDFLRERPISDMAESVNRGSLFASVDIDDDDEVKAIVQIAPERRGLSLQAATSGAFVTAFLWLGVLSGLDAQNPSAAVSLLLGGAALFSGVAASRGEHPLVRSVFSAPRRWLFLVSVVAFAAAAALALQVPCPHPVGVWRTCAILSSVATARLVWSAVQAPG